MQCAANPLQLTLLCAPFAALTLVPLIYGFESQNLKAQAQRLQFDSLAQAVFWANCFAASTYNVSANLLLQQTSPVWMNILGQIRLIGLLGLSTLILSTEKNVFTLKMLLGTGMVAFGVWLYAQNCSKRPKSAQKLNQKTIAIKFEQCKC